MFARRAPEGNQSSGSSQVARQILEADFTNQHLDPSSLVDAPPKLPLPNTLPLDNRPELERMKELNSCKEPGTIFYFEFDLDSCRAKDVKRLATISEDYLNNGFTFRINVRVAMT